MDTEVAGEIQESRASDMTNGTDGVDLRLAVAEQTELLDRLMARVGNLAQRESELRVALLDAHRQLAQRESEMRAALQDVHRQLAERDREAQTQLAAWEVVDQEREEMLSLLRRASKEIKKRDRVIRKLRKTSKKRCS